MGNKKIFPSLKNALVTLFSHPAIIVPFIVIAFIQLLILEIVYFIPRYPLNMFFEPIITKLWGEQFMHYPYNIAIMPKLFQYTQAPMYIFVSSFLIGVAANIIMRVNNEDKDDFGTVFKDTLKHYVHIFCGAVIAFVCVLIFSEIYELLIKKALTMDPMRGNKYKLKKIVRMLILDGAPYFNLLASVFITTFFAYVIPVIVVAKKKIFSAIVENFKLFFGAPWFTFMVVFIPSLIYVPILMLRGGTDITFTTPELSIVLLVISIFAMVAIDAIICTTLTTYYLIKKEES